MRPPQPDLAQQQPAQQPGMQQPGMQPQQPGMPAQQPGMQPQQLGPMQDPMQQTQQANLGFGQQFNEPGAMFNDPMIQQPNKLMEPMMQGAMDQPLRDPVTGQPLRDPVTGQPLFGQKPPDPMGQQGPMGPMGQQLNKPDQAFDPITGMPLNQPVDPNKPNQQMIGPPFDQMNQMNQMNALAPMMDPMLGPAKQFNEINNNLLIGDKLKQQQGAQFGQAPGQPFMDPLSMQNAQLYALENGRFAFRLASLRVSSNVGSWQIRF